MEDLLAERPEEVPAWRLWKRQLADGTLRCPAWCDVCQGDRVFIEVRNGRSQARNCPSCRKRSAA